MVNAQLRQLRDVREQHMIGIEIARQQAIKKLIIISGVKTSRELPLWIEHYNFYRPHSSTESQPPASRLSFSVNNVMRNYS